MYVRLLTASIAALAFTSAVALAQTSSSGTSSGSTTPSTTSPSTTSPSSSGTSSMGSTTQSTTGKSGSSGTTGTTGSGQMAQQPSGAFNPTNYKTQTECLNAATAQHADKDLCKAIGTK